MSLFPVEQKEGKTGSSALISRDDTVDALQWLKSQSFASAAASFGPQASLYSGKIEEDVPEEENTPSESSDHEEEDNRTTKQRRVDLLNKLRLAQRGDENAFRKEPKDKDRKKDKKDKKDKKGKKDKTDKKDKKAKKRSKHSKKDSKHKKHKRKDSSEEEFDPMAPKVGAKQAGSTSVADKEKILSIEQRLFDLSDKREGNSVWDIALTSIIKGNKKKRKHRDGAPDYDSDQETKQLTQRLANASKFFYAIFFFLSLNRTAHLPDVSV